MRVLYISNQNLNYNFGAKIKTYDKLPTQAPNINFIKYKAGNLNLEDAFFDSLKAEYPEFPSWWKKIADRDAYVSISNDGKINALLILKIETNEAIDSKPALNFDKVLKICTLKVANQASGLNIGSRLLQFAFDYAKLNNIDDIYLTHFCQEIDPLVDFFKKYGFNKYGTNSRGEGVFVKKLTKDPYGKQ